MSIPGIALAMPEGTKWRLYNHKREVDLGEVTVLSHRREGIEFHIAAANRVLTLAYPPAGTWKLDQDHIRIGDPMTGKLLATYAPA